MYEDLRLEDLPLDDAARVRYIVAACKELEREMNPTRHFSDMAAELTRRLAGLRGPASRPVSAKTMERLYYYWQQGKKNKRGQRVTAPRCWQAVFDGRTVAANRQQVRTAQPCFRAHLALLASRHPRSLTTAIHELFAEWDNALPIPGYEGMNPTGREPRPAGWSMENLYRLMPDRAALTIMHKGTRAGFNYLAQAHSTRVGLWPGAVYSFDDVWLDCKVRGYDGNGKMQIDRPLQLGCLDRYTGKRISWFTKLRMRGEDGHRLQLTEDEMLYLICDLLLNVGYSVRGTVFVCEHGTANISQPVADALAMLSDGKITVEKSGMTGTRQVGAFEGRAVGNPRFKAELESWHNLLHNRMDGVLTQTGKNRTEPERLYGITEKHDAAIVKAVNTGKGAHNVTLAPAQVAGLATFSMSLGELADVLVQVVGGINKRTDHDLQGWEECGFTQPEFSFNARDGWELLANMKPDAAAEALALAERVPARLRPRKLSPDEAWLHALAQPGNDMVRFTPAQCVTLLGAHRKFKLIHNGGTLFVKGKSRHHRELLFTDEVITASGSKLRLSSSEQWYGVLNPLSEALFVMDERNVVRGVAQRQHRVQHQDEAARLRMFGDMVQRRADELARIENMVAPDTAEHRIQMDYNRRILAGEQVDPLAVTDAAQLRKSRRRSAATTCVGVASEPQGKTRSPMPQPLCAADDYQLPSSYDAPTFL